jgi:hypothetical protein
VPKTRENLNKVSQLRLTDEMYEQLQELATEEERPLAGMIRALLKEAIYYRKIGMNKRIGQLFLSKLGINDPA